MLYRDYLRPDGEWLAMSMAVEKILKPFASSNKPITFCSSIFLSADCRGINDMADGDPANREWRTGVQPEMEYGMDARHARLLELDPWFRQFHQNNITFSIWYVRTSCWP